MIEADVQIAAGSTSKRQLTLLPGLFSGLGAEAKQKIRDGSYTQALQKNELIIRAGQVFHDLIIVQSGWLAADIDEVCVSLLPPNALYCIYVGSEVRAATFNLRAVSSSTSIAVVSRAAMCSVLGEAPALMASICDHILHHVSKSYIDTAKRVTDPIEMRLANFLWSTGSPMADGTRRIPNVIPQQYIASYLGASREEVSRKRQLLIRAGYLSKRDGDWYMEYPPQASAGY